MIGWEWSEWLLHIEDDLRTGAFEMREIKRNADYSKHYEKCGGESPCVVCGKPCPNPQYMIRMDIFLNGLLPDEAMWKEWDLGYFPIGTNCLKKHPELKPYAVKQ